MCIIPARLSIDDFRVLGAGVVLTMSTKIIDVTRNLFKLYAYFHYGSHRACLGVLDKKVLLIDASNNCCNTNHPKERRS